MKAQLDRCTGLSQYYFGPQFRARSGVLGCGTSFYWGFREVWPHGPYEGWAEPKAGNRPAGLVQFPLNFVFRRFGTPQRNVIPEPLMDKIKPNLHHGVDCARPRRCPDIAAEEVNNPGCGEGSENPVANGLGNTAGVGVHDSKSYQSR